MAADILAVVLKAMERGKTKQSWATEALALVVVLDVEGKTAGLTKEQRLALLDLECKSLELPPHDHDEMLAQLLAKAGVQILKGQTPATFEHFMHPTEKALVTMRSGKEPLVSALNAMHVRTCERCLGRIRMLDLFEPLPNDHPDKQTKP